MIPHLPDVVAQPMAWVGIFSCAAFVIVITMCLRTAQKQAAYRNSDDAEELALERLARQAAERRAARREWIA